MRLSGHATGQLRPAPDAKASANRRLGVRCREGGDCRYIGHGRGGWRGGHVQFRRLQESGIRVLDLHVVLRGYALHAAILHRLAQALAMGLQAHLLKHLRETAHAVIRWQLTIDLVRPLRTQGIGLVVAGNQQDACIIGALADGFGRALGVHHP
ncbi:hypothetical protein D3C72_1387930 [compost metagenome]